MAIQHLSLNSCDLTAGGLLNLTRSGRYQAVPRHRAINDGLQPPKALRPRQLIRITYQLATALNGGLGLIPSLVVVKQSSEPLISQVVDALVGSIEQGHSFSEALGQQPASFPSSFRRMVESAELTGNLGFCLQLLAQSLERQYRLRSTLTSAMIYPVSLLLVATVLVWAMLWFVVPMILSVTLEAGVQAPLLTRCLIALTRPQLLASAASGLFVCTGLLRWAWRHPQRGPRLQQWFEECTPLGRFLVHYRTAAAIRQLALMLEGGVDVLRAILYSSRSVEHSVGLTRAFAEVYERVRDGRSLSSSLKEARHFPSILVAMVAVAEETGDLSKMLYRYLEIAEESLTNQIDTAVRLVEPVLLAAMGTVIGLILVASFLPIYQLTNL
ncbi:MAG: type II secretion system F family protein [Vulcanimicrobiota bacterium]